jgi:uncharacterized protein (DUF2235 family)
MAVAQGDHAAADQPRNIVLLSDGTGNSAAKLNKTNVWVLYQALDLGRTDQIAYYDDGVGTSGIRPLRLLGGGFGWGLSRNVRDLYEFLCRHYRKDDNIFIFGFSRGAFTARTLAGLIAKCGILDCSRTVPAARGKQLQLNTREGLKAGVRLAYRSYRQGYKAPFAILYRGVRGKVPEPEELRDRYSFGDVRINFIGVWDTVDVVGLPVDELSTMIDRLFYPHRFPDQDLSDRVDRACHAVAIDDERHTFHPVLWNEKGEQDAARIKQVWFAGMHSNVGGGYPDDDLAFVPLQWMIGEAQAAGLRFARGSLDDIRHRAQPLGKMSDSRRGFDVYYRYNPRHVATLCDDDDAGVWISEPKIHDAAFQRIAENTTGYAPAGLPLSHHVVAADPDAKLWESGPERQARSALLERAQHHVFWRRVLYYLLVAVTAALVLLPYFRPAIEGAAPGSALERVLSILLGWLPALLPGFVGSWAGWWTDGWTQSAWWFLALAVLLVALLGHSRWIDGNIHRLSEVAWWHIKRCPKPRPPTPAVGRFERLAAWLRGNVLLQQLRRLTIKWIGPILTLLVVATILAGALYRVSWHNAALGSGVCNRLLQERHVAGCEWSKAVTFDFATKEPCVDTGVDLQAGRSYRVEIRASGWQDDGYPADLDGITGVRYRLDPVFVIGIPARRKVTLPWFTLVAEIGRDSGHAFAFNRKDFIFEATRGGRLYLYVNDAIDAVGEDWQRYYRKNQGTAKINVTPQH